MSFVTLFTRDNIFDLTFCPHFSENAFVEVCKAKVEEDTEKEQSRQGGKFSLIRRGCPQQDDVEIQYRCCCLVHLKHTSCRLA